MLEKRKRGRPRIHPTATPPAPGPVVFLTRVAVGRAVAHETKTPITKNYRKMGLKKIMLNRRWLVALSQVEDIERTMIGGK